MIPEPVGGALGEQAGCLEVVQVDHADATLAPGVVAHEGQAAAGGVDLFRVFDCLNWVENMRVSMDAVQEAGKLCEGVLCYTGDMLDSARVMGRSLEKLLLP